MRKLLLLLSLIATQAAPLYAVEYLKQSTAVTRKIGPFTNDEGAAQTSLTLSAADFRLSKNGGNFADKNESSSATHDELGYYDVAFDTTDTGTLGSLFVAVHEAGTLPVWKEYLVVPANVYDSLVGTDLLNVDPTQLGGDAQSLTDLKDFADAGYDPSTNRVSGTVSADLISVLGTTLTETTPGTLGGNFNSLFGNNDGSSSFTLDDLSAIKTRTDRIPNVAAGASGGILIAGSNAATTFASVTVTGNLSINGTNTVAQTGDSFARIGSNGGGLTAIPWNASWDAEVQSEANDAIVANNLDHLLLVAVTGSDVTDNSALAKLASKSATADWDTFTNSTDSLEALADSGGGGPTAADIADAVWDEDRTGHTTSGTFGYYVDSSISGVSTGGVSAGDIADAVLDEVMSGHTTNGTLGKYVADILADTGTDGVLLAPGQTIIVPEETVDEIAAAVDAPTKSEFDAAVATLATASSLSTMQGDVTSVLADTNEMQGLLTTGGAIRARFPGSGTLTVQGDLSSLATSSAVAGIDTKLGTPADTIAADIAGIEATADLSPVTAVTDKLDDMLEDAGGGLFKFTSGALIETPAGEGGGLDAAGVRAAIGMASANLDTQLAGLPTDSDVQTAAAAALSSYDPPTKAELDTAVSGLATQSSVNDLPTNDELATALEGVTVDLQPVLDAVAGVAEDVLEGTALAGFFANQPAADVELTEQDKQDIAQETTDLLLAEGIAVPPDTRDLGPVQHVWQLKRSGDNTLRSTNPWYVTKGDGEGTGIRGGWNCDIPSILPPGTVIATQANPPELVTASDDITITHIGHDGKMAKVQIAIADDAEPGSHWIKTQVTNSNNGGPVTVYGEVVIQAEPE